MVFSREVNTGCPTPATLARSKSVMEALHLTYTEAVRHLSQLRGRTFREYCSNENVPGYLHKVFNEEEQNILDSGRPIEQLETKLLYKILKYMCGLPKREDHVWLTVSDTIEYFISFTCNEIKTLQEASGLTDYTLNLRLNKLVECLIGILLKVERKKPAVDLTPVKKKVLDSLASQASISDVDYCFKLATQQLIHQVFRLTYNQLNVLDGKSVVSYLEENSKYHNPLRSFSAEEKYLLRKDNTTSDCMTIGLLYRLLIKVCGLKSQCEWAVEGNSLEYSLYTLKGEHATILSMDNKSITDRSRRIYKHLENVLSRISEKKGKPYRQLIAEMPGEKQCLDDFFQKLPREIHQPPPSTESPPRNPIDSRTSVSSASALCSRDSNEQNPLSPEEFNMAILFKAVRPGGIAAEVLFTAYIELSGNINIVNSEHFSKFTTIEKETLKAGRIHEADITLLSKLLRFACGLAKNGEVWSTQGDTVEHYIFCVKKERNDFAHELISLTDGELKTRLENLENNLENILLKVSERKSVDLQSQIDDMKKKLKALRTPFSTNSYCSSVKEMKEMLSDKMVNEAKNELKQAYQTVKASSPITWIHERLFENLTIDKVFMDLDIVDAGDEGASQKYPLEYLLRPWGDGQSNARVIVLQGESGVGKTTLCKYIVHLWSKDTPHSSLKDVDLLLYIQCRHITSSSSLASYLKATAPHTFSSIDEGDIIPLLQDPRLLFVVDGYDEAQENAKNLLDDILRSLPESRMIITSKPQWVPKLKSKVHRETSGSNCTLLSVIGCNKDMRQQYIQKYFTAILEGDAEKLDKCNAFLSFVSGQEDKLQALTQKPLTLALLACLWIWDAAKAEKTRTVAQLYRTITDFTVKRFEFRKNVTDYESFLEWLGEIAWNNLQKNQHSLSEKDIKNLKKKGRAEEIDITKALPYFLHCGTQASLTDSTVWTFTHNSQQEYLSSEYISSQYTDESNKPLEELLGLTEDKDIDKKLQRLVPVIEFISDLLYHSGEMNEKRLKEIAEITLKVQAPWSFASVRRMFQQLVIDVPKYADVLKKMLEGQKLNDFLEGYDPEVIQWILENTSMAVPSYLHLRNSATSVLKMTSLLELLNKRGCKPEVIVIIDSVSSINKIVDVAEEIESRTARFAIMPWKPHTLAALVGNWHWSQPLCLYFDMEVFPLLWWKLVVNLVVAKVPGVLEVQHGLSDTRLIETGVDCLGAKVRYIPDHSASQLRICAIDEKVNPAQKHQD